MDFTSWHTAERLDRFVKSFKLIKIFSNDCGIHEFLYYPHFIPLIFSVSFMWFYPSPIYCFNGLFLQLVRCRAPSIPSSDRRTVYLLNALTLFMRVTRPLLLGMYVTAEWYVQNTEYDLDRSQQVQCCIEHTQRDTRKSYFTSLQLGKYHTFLTTICKIVAVNCRCHH